MGASPAGWSALSLRRIGASARVNLRHANRAAVSEKSVGTPTFALTGASAAPAAEKHSGWWWRGLRR
jgi:hypothetical protein